ncbi:MAG: type II toxin-antitoxin system VapC family toxin [Wenzhouxiangellaceae bacterium]
MSGVVLDASALLAFLHDEPGGHRVSQVLDGATVSTVNWSEVLQKALQRNVDIEGMQQEFVDVGVVFEPFSPRQAEIAARLWSLTRKHGLSLADRACLALATDTARPLLTADQAWNRLGLEIEIRMVR